VDDLTVADDVADAAVLLHVEEAGIGGDLAVVVLRGGGSGSNARALVVGSVDMIRISSALDGEGMAGDGLANERLLQDLVTQDLEGTSGRSGSDIITLEVSYRRLRAGIAAANRVDETNCRHRDPRTSKCKDKSEQNNALH